MRKKFFIFLLSMLVLSSLGVSLARAGDANVLGLAEDSSTTYDIYLGGYTSGLPVLKSVQIMEIRFINNIAFLVVRTDALFSKRAEGLVRLDYVQAVLPTFSGQPIQNSR